MATYAMICENRVIDILYEQGTKPKWPPVPGGAEVVAVECGDDVERGMAYDPETGGFAYPVYPKPEAVTPEPTNEELYQAETLLMQTEMLAVQKEQDEVLAAILLNQMEV